MNIDYYIALQHCRPKAIWTMGETYESLEWLDQQQIKPTHQELIDAYHQAKAILDARKVWKNSAEFWNEFTTAEQAAILTSASTTIKILDKQLTLWAGEVWSDDERVVQGMNALVKEQILSPERKAQILSK